MRNDHSSNVWRVLVVIRWPLGGIRTYILYNYPTLVAAGYQFTFVAPTDALFATFKSEVMGWEGSEWFDVPVSGQKCSIWPVAHSLLRTNRFSLIHSHGFTAASHAALANFFKRTPHLFTSHDVIRSHAQFPGIIGNVRRWLLGNVLNKSDLIVAVSEDARTNLLQCLPTLKKNETKIITIPNGIDVSLFSTTSHVHKADLRKQLGLSSNTFLLGFIGRIEEQKGFLPLIYALEKVVDNSSLPPFHLVILGRDNCPRRYRAELEKRPKVSQLLTFMPAVADIRPVLSELDLFVMPSLWEACPLLPQEAMCAGIPVLGSDCIGLREVLRDTPSMIVPAGNVHALAAGISAAIEKPWKDKACSFASMAQSRFDVTKSAKQLLSIFDKLTS